MAKKKRVSDNQLIGRWVLVDWGEMGKLPGIVIDHVSADCWSVFSPGDDNLSDCSRSYIIEIGNKVTCKDTGLKKKERVAKSKKSRVKQNALKKAFNAYQATARETAVYPLHHRFDYPALGLAGEAGEVANKVKKMFRDDLGSDELREPLRKELGDILWYVAALCTEFQLELGDVAQDNLAHLRRRQQMGTIHGSGDTR
jgi:NTP pyrophosphatase (non-canonical NTP hydrolase)